jgi:hypothetical protein
MHCFADAAVELNNYLNRLVIKNKELRDIFRHKKNEVI